MEFIVKEVVSREDKNAIYQGLLKYNLARIEDKEPKDLGIYLEDASGNKIADNDSSIKLKGNLHT